MLTIVLSSLEAAAADAIRNPDSRSLKIIRTVSQKSSKKANIA